MTKVKIKQAKMTMAKAIRAKCLACVCGQEAEVRKCDLLSCPLFPYRFGCRPETYISRNKDIVKIVL